MECWFVTDQGVHQAAIPASMRPCHGPADRMGKTP